MSTAMTIAPATEEREQCLVLSRISWEQYEAVLSAFADQGGLRITYNEGRLTLLSPRRRHDWHEHAIGRFIEAVATGLGIAWEPSGHTTYRREDVAGGVEGDGTFYFGANAEAMRGPVDIDLETQPPPDLAVEVELTHKADDSVTVWGRLGVSEVWRFDVDRESLIFGIRRPDGSYAPGLRSEVLPGLEPADVLEQLRLAKELGSSRWLVQLRDWVRDVLLPRLGR